MSDRWPGINNSDGPTNPPDDPLEDCPHEDVDDGVPWSTCHDCGRVWPNSYKAMYGVSDGDFI